MTHLTPALLATLALTTSAHAAFTITLNADDFTTTPTFSDVQTFQIEIVVDARLEAGRLYDNPTLQRVTYLVEGTLEPGTPSGFPAFRLERDITGEEFYDQGSSFRFGIRPDADLTDGLQINETIASLSGGGQRSEPASIIFDAREINTGRYHPPYLWLRAGNADGYIYSSNNNPVFLEPDDPANITLGYTDEYETRLEFNASTITIAIPEPTTATLLALSMYVLTRRTT